MRMMIPISTTLAMVSVAERLIPNRPFPSRSSPSEAETLSFSETATGGAVSTTASVIRIPGILLYLNAPSVI